LLRDPALFEGYVAVDPSLWWDHEAVAKEAEGLLAAHSGGERMLFLAVANEGAEMRAGQDALAAAVETVAVPGLTLVYRPMEDERHSTIYHRAALEGLRVVFANPPEQDAP
jgi:predicted alpha/beta superfamily hydrolase